MRKQDSITGIILDAISTVPVGSTFTSKWLRENFDVKCSNVYGPWQRMNTITCMLNKTGLIERVKRGEYMVKYPIPAELDSTDLEMYIGYTTKIEYSPHAGYRPMPRKDNPLDIEAYKASIDQAASFNADEEDEHPTVHSGAGTVETSDEYGLKTIYMVNMTTGEITPIQVMEWDNSHLTMPNVFDDKDAAEAFAEGITPPQPEQPQGPSNSDHDLSRVEEDMYSELVDETEQKYEGPTEEQFEAAKERYIKEEFMTPSDLKTAIVDAIEKTLPFKIGNEVYVISGSLGNGRITTEEIEEIEVEISGSDSYIEIETSGSEFEITDYNVKFFTDKQKAIARLAEII